MGYDKEIVEKVSGTLVKAGSVFREDKKAAYKRAIEKEKNPQARWVLETILENAKAAESGQSPLCDDTGIPHLLLEVGDDAVLTGNMLRSVKEGIRQGLRRLPGRPMAALGDDIQRIEQSAGLDDDPAGLEPAPLLLRQAEGGKIRLHIMMLGGGPAIRGRTYRVFHRHDADVVIQEIIGWAKESAAHLGCTPCVLAVGIGRSHYEASAMMIQAMADGRFGRQTEMEQKITDGVNQAGTGALGLGGDTTVLATFLKVGPQRASGVRIVCMRPCCCFEPRLASVEL